MTSKTLPFGVVIPKIVSETKTVVVKKAARGAVVKPVTSVQKKSNRARLRSMDIVVPFASLASLFLIIGLAGFHLYSVNAYSSKGFELKRHQAVIAELTEQNKRLVVRQAEMGSIMQVSDTATQLGLVPIAHEEYIVSKQITHR